jgi:Malonyl-CoA decarboxylase C-terminal domain
MPLVRTDLRNRKDVGYREDIGRAVNEAIFCSISNCQPGLRGISFGGFLIKQVVELLRSLLNAPD